MPRADNSSVYHIFERLNTGGTALKPQEIRNCVYRGQIVSVIRKLNEDSNWRKLLGKQSLDRHQRDVELVLRVFSLFEDWEKYEKPMKEYLNSMRLNVRFNSVKARRFEKLFPKACETMVKILGSKPFHVRGPLNTSVLDATIVAVLENSGTVHHDFAKGYKELIRDETFEQWTRTSTTDTMTVRARMNAGMKLVT
jgi:hypothetical protein